MVNHIQQYIIPLFKETGFFVEIGCWNGEHISQSIELEKLGWTGVCVDPFPEGFENRTCRVVEKAVSKDGKPRKFIKVTIDRRHGGDVSYFSGFKDSINQYWEVIKNHCNFEEFEIDTIRFDDLKLPDHINFLSVDTEGSEFEIISSIDFKKYSFDVIMFEHNGIDNGVGKVLRANGYRMHRPLSIDDIFIKI